MPILDFSSRNKKHYQLLIILAPLIFLLNGCGDAFSECYKDPMSPIATTYESYAVHIEIRRNDTIQKFDKIFVCAPVYRDIYQSYSPFSIPLHLKTNNMHVVFQKTNISSDTIQIGYDVVVDYNFNCDNGKARIENRRLLTTSFDSTYSIKLTK